MSNNNTEFINELVKLTKLYESCTLMYIYRYLNCASV